AESIGFPMFGPSPSPRNANTDVGSLKIQTADFALASKFGLEHFERDRHLLTSNVKVVRKVRPP
ncbi:6380_t:CDS:1, partial [Acaulospora colombiana]